MEKWLSTGFGHSLASFAGYRGPYPSSAQAGSNLQANQEVSHHETDSNRRQRRCVGAIRGIGDGRRSSLPQGSASLRSAAAAPADVDRVLRRSEHRWRLDLRWWRGHLVRVL